VVSVKKNHEKMVWVREGRKGWGGVEAAVGIHLGKGIAVRAMGGTWG